ncbi:hypothetical protein ONS95_003797 [Cadophora gregata]|uniref:uncharacterized protein n=1 Tax=Cadophora gregata TaxID=51156 RepID=UPI0026DC03D3|nr:uncharacterized protein ONS95_003797 [Cadophora gregata]KAK0107091.1 hypothetical protein ONS95_003797 [Cadophora gregata]
MTIRTRKRNQRQNSSRRGGSRRGHITRIDVRHCYFDEEIESQEREQEEWQGPQLDQTEPPKRHEQTTEVVQPETEQPDMVVEEMRQSTLKRRRVGQRELKSLHGGNSDDHEPMGRSRDRKPPQRYGY